LFCRGELVFTERTHPLKTFQWVYDCGSENGDIVNGEIDLYRRYLPDPKRLDLLVLSHFDNDHVKGVGRLLDGLPLDHLILPYLNPTQRMLLVAGAGPDNPDYIRFLVSPVDYLLTLPGVEIGTITFIQPGQGPLPTEGGGTQGTSPPGDQPTKVLLEGKDPTKDEFRNDPGMVVRHVGAGRTQVRVTREARPMEVLGLWEFAFYNLPQPELQAQLQADVQPVFEAFYWQPEDKRNYDDFIHQLRGTYRGLFGGDEDGRNDISLVTYTGPMMQQFESAHYGCINHCHYPATREGRGPHGGREQDCPDGKISALYTGDLNIKKSVTAAVKTFLGDDRWRRIRFLQVPHHGSKKSWECGQSGLWHHDWSVFSAGLNNRYKHPHQPVLDDLKLHNSVLVNQLQGVAWGGMAGWKNTPAAKT
jgi:hypothetical protein